MDPFHNPFAPGAGSRPPELAGRDAVLNVALTACGRLLKGRNGRPMMLLGLRGTGKTVLLNEIGRRVVEHGFVVSKIESPEDDSLAALLYPQMKKVLRSLSTAEKAKNLAQTGLAVLHRFASKLKIEVGGVEISVEPPAGVADSGKLELDLPDLFTAIGEAAKAAGKGWMLLIDEIQYLNQKDLSALIVSLHLMSQLELPVMFVGAGLPSVAKLAGDAKSYAERLFRYCEVGPLESEAVRVAIVKPIEEEGASIEADAVAEMERETHGYPFFLQEWAYCAWNVAEGAVITRKDIEQSFEETIGELDQGFFRVRLDRLTPQEIMFVEAMALLGAGPYRIGEIAEIMGKTSQSVGPIKSRITEKGMIYSPKHGFVAFTVPLFDEFVRRERSSVESNKKSADASGHRRTFEWWR